jgi:hypothetical protein
MSFCRWCLSDTHIANHPRWRDHENWMWTKRTKHISLTAAHYQYNGSEQSGHAVYGAVARWLWFRLAGKSGRSVEWREVCSSLRMLSNCVRPSMGRLMPPRLTREEYMVYPPKVSKHIDLTLQTRSMHSARGYTILNYIPESWYMIFWNI